VVWRVVFAVERGAMTGRLSGDIVLLLFTVSQRSRLTRQGTDTDDDTALRGMDSRERLRWTVVRIKD
jgi:hypothetical protein